MYESFQIVQYGHSGLLTIFIIHAVCRPSKYILKDHGPRNHLLIYIIKLNYQISFNYCYNKLMEMVPVIMVDAIILFLLTHKLHFCNIKKVAAKFSVKISSLFENVKMKSLHR